MEGDFTSYRANYLCERVFAAAWGLKDLALAKSFEAELPDPRQVVGVASAHARALASIALLEDRSEDAKALIVTFYESATAAEKLLGHPFTTDRAFVAEMERTLTQKMVASP